MPRSDRTFAHSFVWRAKRQHSARRSRSIGAPSHVPMSQENRLVRVRAGARDIRVDAHEGAHVASARPRAHNRFHWDV